MITPISTATAFLYQKAAKPILFKFPPDNVHNTVLKATELTGKVPPLRWLARSCWRYDDPRLETDVLGLHFKTPLGLSAGFDKEIQTVGLMQSIGFGFIEAGSVTYKPAPGNKRPWFYRLPEDKSIVVHAGLPSTGMDSFIARAKRYTPQTFDTFPLNVSVGKTNSPETVGVANGIADYVAAFEQLDAAAIASLYTLNISCPNTFGGEPFSDVKSLDKLLSALDALHLKKPLMVKMPIDKDWSEFKKLLEVIAKHNTAGVTIGNLAKDRSKLHLKGHLPASVPGNLSGRPTFELSNALIGNTYKHYKDRLVISGVGGIFTAEDAYKKVQLGASLLEMITGLIFQGPQVVGQINQGLAELLKKDGFSTFAEAIGSAHQ